MTITVAMSGLAEAAESFALLIVALTLILSAALIAFGCRKRWVGLAGLGWSLCIIAGLLLQPWNFFRGPENPGDSDEIYWITRQRIACLIWVATFAVEHFYLRTLLRRQDTKQHVQKEN
jgi:hypothetical protein